MRDGCMFSYVFCNLTEQKLGMQTCLLRFFATSQATPLSWGAANNHRQPPHLPPHNRQTWGPRDQHFGDPSRRIYRKLIPKVLIHETVLAFVAQATKLRYCRHFVFLIEACPLSMLDLSHCFPSLNAFPFSLPYLFDFWTSLNALPFSALYLSLCFTCLFFFQRFTSFDACVTSLNALPFSLLSPFPILYLSQFFIYFFALPLSILHLCHCFTSFSYLPLSVLDLSQCCTSRCALPLSRFISLEVVIRMAEVLTSFFWWGLILCIDRGLLQDSEVL